MTKQLLLEFSDGPRAIATLNEEYAPVTCQTLWDALAIPATMDAMHAIYAGPEIMVGLPEANRTFDPEAVPAENQQVIPAPGDLQWYYQRPMQMGGLPFELWEIGVFYAKGARTFGPLGWTPVNIFASITEGLEEFAKACESTRFEGMKTLTISRLA
jgi:hypothetical protein